MGKKLGRSNTGANPRAKARRRCRIRATGTSGKASAGTANVTFQSSPPPLRAPNHAVSAREQTTPVLIKEASGRSDLPSVPNEH